MTSLTILSLEMTSTETIELSSLECQMQGVLQVFGQHSCSKKDTACRWVTRARSWPLEHALKIDIFGKT